MSDGLRVDQIKKKPYGDFNVGTLKTNMQRIANNGQMHIDVKALPNILNGTQKTSNAAFSG